MRAARGGRRASNYLDAGVAGRRTVPGATSDDWLDCGQCRDCFLPAFNYAAEELGAVHRWRSRTSTTRANPRRFRFGFIASSDNHSARPGTGYKEFGRA